MTRNDINRILSRDTQPCETPDDWSMEVRPEPIAHSSVWGAGVVIVGMIFIFVVALLALVL